jgi:hypothetical protein
LSDFALRLALVPDDLHATYIAVALVEHFPVVEVSNGTATATTPSAVSVAVATNGMRGLMNIPSF